jgi:hypothetical protein
MRTKLIVWFACLFLFLAGSLSFAALNSFTGTWVNTDTNTRGITKLVITTSPTPADDPHITVHAWGKCHPSDCDWGAVVGHAYCPTVSSNMVTTARAIVAVFTTSFSQTTLVIKRSGTRLTVQSFTRFTDNSNRRNYDESYTFKRVRLAMPAFEQPHEPPVPLQPPSQ